MNAVPLFKDMYQIAYVTADLDAAMSELAGIHGTAKFRVKRNVKSSPGMPDMLMHQAHVFIGATQIELIQPAGGDDALYRDFCSPDSATIRHHHFGMWVDDPDVYHGLPAVLAERDIPVTFQMSIANVGGAIYADTRRTLGHYLEYVNLLPHVKETYYADVPRY
jgi:hypothetical protein